MTTFADSGTETRRQTTERKATVRHYVMTPPRFFSVDYVINPWMDATTPVDARVALAQWRQLHDVYVELGHSSIWSIRYPVCPTWCTPPMVV